MLFDQHKDFAVSTVATAPSPATSGTSLSVATGDGAKFPTPPFNAVVAPSGAAPSLANAEIIRVTAVSGDNFTTIQRATTTEPTVTTAQAIAVGWQIFTGVTAKTLLDIEGNIGAIIPARAYRGATGATVGSGNTKISLDTISFDPSGSFDVVTNHRFNAPVAGYYLITLAIALTSTAAGQSALPLLYKNGSIVSGGTEVWSQAASESIQATVSDIIYCNAGDYIEPYANSNASLVLGNGSGTTYMTVVLLASLPGAVGTTTVARAYRNAAFNCTAGAIAQVPLDTRSFDPGNNWNLTNHQYVVPATGYYAVDGCVGLSGSTPGWSTGIVYVYKNGAEALQGQRVSNAANGIFDLVVGDVIQCNAGDVLDLRVYCDQAAPVSNNANETYLSVVQTGNSMNFTSAGGDLTGTYPNPKSAIDKDWLQNGVVGGGDLAVSGISVASNGAITFTVAAGVVWVMGTNGILMRVVLPSAQTLTLTPSALPAASNTAVEGIEIDTNGQFYATAKGADSAGNVAIGTPASPATTAGRVRFLDVSIFNNAGTYQLSSNVAATQGTNWRDRRPWARGAYAKATETATNPSTASTTFGVLDNNLQTRLEHVTGLVRVKLSGTLALSVAGQDVIFDLTEDGGLIGQRKQFVFSAASNSMDFECIWDLTVSAGSHLWNPNWTVTSGTATITTSSPWAPLVVVIEEIMRQNAGNGVA